STRESPPKDPDSLWRVERRLDPPRERRERILGLTGLAPQRFQRGAAPCHFLVPEDEGERRTAAVGAAELGLEGPPAEPELEAALGQRIAQRFDEPQHRLPRALPARDHVHVGWARLGGAPLEAQQLHGALHAERKADGRRRLPAELLD